ncbi:MAG TPA: zf-HC2 domain-containing protein [Longimicrobiaceae bacterium]|nr:zf-HC2 domain-containing protein [Longimicrobiaceae bacterium]
MSTPVPIPTCREVLSFLHEYVAGELTPARAAAFEWHLERCPSCAAYLHSYRRTVELEKEAFDVETAPPPRELVAAVLALRRR